MTLALTENVAPRHAPKTNNLVTIAPGSKHFRSCTVVFVTIAGVAEGARGGFGGAEIEDEDSVFVDVGVVKANRVRQTHAVVAGKVV